MKSATTCPPAAMLNDDDDFDFDFDDDEDDGGEDFGVAGFLLAAGMPWPFTSFCWWGWMRVSP